MDILLTRGKWQLALGYLDDIEIFLRTPDKQIEHFRQVLTLLSDKGIALRFKKRESFTNCIDYIDRAYSPRSVGDVDMDDRRSARTRAPSQPEGNAIIP